MTLLADVQSIIDSVYDDTLLDSSVVFPVTVCTISNTTHDATTGYHGPSVFGASSPIQPTVTYTYTSGSTTDPMTFTVSDDGGTQAAALIALGWSKPNPFKIDLRRDPTMANSGAPVTWFDVEERIYQYASSNFVELTVSPVTVRLTTGSAANIPCVGAITPSWTSIALGVQTWSLMFNHTVPAIMNAIKQEYSLNQVAHSNGTIQVGDVLFTLRSSDSGRPDMGSIIIDNIQSKRYQILNIMEKALGTTSLLWRCHCRPINTGAVIYV